MIEIGCPPTFISLLARAFSLLVRHTAVVLPCCAASSFPYPLPRSRVVAVKPASLARPLAMPHATLTSPSFSCARLFYRSSVVSLDLHVEVILMRIAQLHVRDVPPLRSHCPPSFMMTAGNAFEWRKIRCIYHAWSQAVDAYTG
jgi:hypothetical protein